MNRTIILLIVSFYCLSSCAPEAENREISTINVGTNTKEFTDENLQVEVIKLKYSADNLIGKVD